MLRKRIALAAGAFSVAMSVGTAAGACEFYKAIDTRSELFDMPDSGAGLAVAILPEASQACVMEEKTDGSGQTWYRLAFYTADDIKYNVDGWVREGAVADAQTPPTQVAAVENARQAQPEQSGGKEAFFARDWTLDKTRSQINFITIKKGTVIETHSFGDLEGSVSADGTAELKIKLESVNTGIDIRDVRMRFLLFNVDEFPEAEVTAKIDPAAIDRIWDDATMKYDLPITVSIRGLSQEFTVPVIISRLKDDMVSVVSASPVTVSGSDFGMEDGLKKLSEAAGDIAITPSAPVTFDLAFVPAS
ncbi:YceI family protein [Jiella marina]|uniref:YceI family protein n=1 Tax=Jiella sp. LLJ827 TaxID=2917712 RepID=UPI0021014047|nr:YceI family protein [Jiella sp. LLJ827]MCQ0986724.1 YceI family protein [Jiella sp. LLJ827]